MTTTSPAPARTVQLPSTVALLSTVFTACVLFPLAVFTSTILLTDEDPYRSEGAVESIVSISVVAGVAVVLAIGLGAFLVRSPERARAGAVVFAVLAVLTMIVFWSGTPGMFGAAAAWLAGLTRGGRPLDGTARIAGIVGVFVAVLNMLLSVGGILLSAIA